MVNLSITKKGGDDGESEIQLKGRFKAWWSVCCDPDSWRFVARLVVFVPCMIVILIWALIVATLDRVRVV